jgi:CelD/BcsL family acetyltransferase involved in cellulose biosynthesis
MDTLIRDVEAIASKSYQRAIGVGFSVSDISELRVDALRSALRAYVLYIDWEPCAFLIATWYKGTAYGRSIGYDPRYRRYSPGQYLLMRFIEDCLAPTADQQTMAIDPGAGGQHYKRSFTNHVTKECSVAVYAPSVKGVFLNILRTTMLAGNRAGKALLAKSGLSERVWKVWRSWHQRGIRS